jgi:foldase protein PrsA
MIVLLVVACNGNGGDAQPTSSRAVEATIVVVDTSVPSQETPVVAATTAVPTAAPTPTPPAPLAAVVNGEYIFLSEYERRVAQYEEALQQQGLDASTPEGEAHLAQARRDVLEGLIDGVLIQQGAAALGVSLTDEELESQIESDIEEGGGQAAFDEWLQATGQTRDDYKEMLRQSLVSQRVLDAVTADVPAETEQVRARHIVVDTAEEARQILAMLQEGADFVALAREHSTDLATKDNGGDLGWFPRGLVAPELEAAAFGLQPGQVSDVIPLGEGYHIVQVVERDEVHPLSPDMQMDLKLALFDRWLADLRATAVIERFIAD